MGTRMSFLGAAVIASLAAFGGPTVFGQAGAPAAVKTEPYTWKSVTIKANGFVNGIVFSPAQKDLIYINTDMGGAYRWDQAEGKWTCLTDWIQYNDWSLSQMGVETIAVDPTDANRVYAGLGTYMGPSAVVRSTDQGRTWQRTNVPFPMNGNGSARNSGQRMMVDPNKPSILFYGTRTKGLWKSSDYGASWEAVPSFPATGDSQGAAREAGVVWVLFDKTSATPGNPTQTIYAGVMTVAAQKVFRSLDGGATWMPIANQPGGDLLPTRAALTPDGKTIYLTYGVGQGYPGPHSIVGGAVYKLTDPAGAAPTWTDISPSTGRFGWSGIAIDPKNPDTILTSVLNRYNPTDDIYRSTDAGKSWTPLNINNHRDDSSAPYAKYMGVHWIGDVQIDPFDSNHAQFTTGFGIYDTRNLSAPEPQWAFFNEGFEQSAVLELVSPPTGSAHLLSAIGDRDGYRHEDFNVSPPNGHFGAAQRRWIGSCPEVDIAWNDPNIVVRVGRRCQYSLDGGVTWEWFAEAPSTNPTTAQTRPRRGGGRLGNLALSADGSRVVWATSSAMLYATRDGATWSPWTQSTGGPAGNANVVAGLANPKRLYARAGNSFYISDDAGASWTPQGDQVPQSVHWIRPVFGQEGHLWASAGGNGLHRTTDGGKTWTKIADGVVTTANQLGIGAAAPGQSYPAVFVAGTVGGQNGFFRSDDQGATWVRVNDDQHHYGNPTVIQGDPRIHGRIYVGTNGRGILYADRATPAGN